MGWIGRLLGREPQAAPSRGWRSYVGARLGSSNVLASLQSKDAELRKDLLALRRNSRILHNNNPFMRRYLRTLGSQVVGPHGVRLQSKAPGSMAASIEDAWARWGMRGVCTVDGRQSWAGLQRQFIKTIAQDGEAFVRLVRGRGQFAFQVQLLDADLLDHTFSRAAGGGHNAIVMGVEIDSWGAPVAYHFSDPAQASTLYSRAPRIRIPAEEIIHGFDPERAATQTRGVPWASSAMYLLDMLGHYWESEVAAARHEAERQGFITSELEEDGPTSEEEAITAPTQENIPGTVSYWRLPAGHAVTVPDLQHPATAFGEFSKAMLKGIASGLGISYASLSSDLTQVSFASIRQGVLEDRDWYRELQQELLVQTLCERVYAAWWDMAIVSGQLRLDGRVSFAAVSQHRWVPRGWPWVDPNADSKAIAQDLASGLTSRTRVCAARGEDFEEIVSEREAEEKRLRSAGIVLAPVPKTPEPHNPQDAQEEPENA